MFAQMLARMIVDAANDNAPHNPRDFEDFDPAEMPEDFFYQDDTLMDVATFMSRYA